MPRLRDGLQRIKDEIDNNPGVYNKKTPAEIAILMKRRVSRQPKEFDIVEANPILVMESHLSKGDLDTIAAAQVTAGKIPADELQDKQVEITDRRCDILSLGDVTQGDVESALALQAEVIE